MIQKLAFSLATVLFTRCNDSVLRKASHKIQILSIKKDNLLFGGCRLYIPPPHCELLHAKAPPNMKNVLSLYLTKLLVETSICDSRIPDLIPGSIKVSHFTPILTYISHKTGAQAFLVTYEIS